MATSGALILVVEDDRPMRFLLREVLLGAGYRVVEAPDGSTAWAQLQADVLDLVLLDILLPDIDGYEVARRIRAEPALARLPVLMLTGLERPAEAVLGFRAGADDYVRKPFSNTELLARIRRLLRPR